MTSSNLAYLAGARWRWRMPKSASHRRRSLKRRVFANLMLLVPTQRKIFATVRKWNGFERIWKLIVYYVWDFKILIMIVKLWLIQKCCFEHSATHSGQFGHYYTNQLFSYSSHRFSVVAFENARFYYRLDKIEFL